MGRVSEHLTANELEQYARGSAAPELLLSWDDHLAGCGTCRSRMPAMDALARWAAGLAGEEHERHLTYQQISQTAEKRIPEDEVFEIRSHLNGCQACRDEVADLSRLRHGMTRGWQRPWWAVAAAASVVALVAGVWYWRGTAAPALSLPESWSREDRADVESVLRAGRLPERALPADLAVRRSILLGAAESGFFAPLSPISEIVETDHPCFKWQPLSGAKAYMVEVYDSDFRLAIRSPWVTQTAWTAPQPLERGQRYSWQISALREGATFTAPQPPAPEARFRVLDRAKEEAIARARASGSLGHLLAAVLLAEAGMQPDAAAELTRLPAKARRIAQIEKLVASSRSRP